MGRRTAIVTEALKERLFAFASDRANAFDLSADLEGSSTHDGERLWAVTMWGERLGEGDNGHVQVVAKQDGSFAFVPYVTDFWEN